ncbi:MAG: isoprenylcysteine carboxylmethyltransferase family protein [Pseudomonadota bacterium]
MKVFDYPPLWLLAFMGVAYGWSLAWSFDLTELAVTGGLFMVLALGVMVWAAVTLARAKTTVIPHRAPDALVISGPFRFTRNPIYLADLAFLFGFALAVEQPLAASLCLPFFVVLDRRFAAPEERRLHAAFGEDFVAYANRVRRWL